MSNSEAQQQTNAEHTVSITTDARTFEQREQDSVANLERKQKANAAEEGKQMQASTMLERHNPRSDWRATIEQWITQTRKRWTETLSRAYRNMFQLVPKTRLEPEETLPVKEDAFRPMGHLSTIVKQMQKQLDALDQYIPDPVSILSDFDRTASAIVGLSAHVRPLCPLGYLPESYVMNDRGEVTFRSRFNTKGFHPDQLHVASSKNRLTVSGKRSIGTNTSSSVSEFLRTIYLPESVDHTRLECHLTKDGVLTVEAPVTGVKPEALGLDSNAQLAVRPQAPEKGSALQLNGVPGVQIMPSQSGGQMVHVEVPVDEDFRADDLLVEVDANRVNVSGKKLALEGSGDVQCDYIKQFSRSYVVPQTLDTMSLRSQLIGHTLVVEAPLVPTQ